MSVLDLAWRGYGQTNADAVRDAIELAQFAEEEGFYRYWSAAHHGLPVSAASQPPIIMAAAASRTTTIRIGSGPLLLSNYSPLAIAEQFGTLAALSPGRIDLGIGRSSGGFPPVAVRRTTRTDNAPSHDRDVLELLHYFETAGAGQRSSVAVPGLGDAPEPWLLGSASGYSARLAAALGLPYAHAHHFSADTTKQVLDLYRREFRPSGYRSEPHTMLTAMLASAETTEQLQEDMLLSDVTNLHLLRGERPEVTSKEEALNYALRSGDRKALSDRRIGQAIGTPNEILEQLESLLATTAVDEIMFQVVGDTATSRQRSLRMAREISTIRTR